MAAKVNYAPESTEILTGEMTECHTDVSLGVGSERWKHDLLRFAYSNKRTHS